MERVSKYRCVYFVFIPYTCVLENGEGKWCTGNPTNSLLESSFEVNGSLQRLPCRPAAATSSEKSHSRRKYGAAAWSCCCCNRCLLHLPPAVEPGLGPRGPCHDVRNRTGTAYGNRCEEVLLHTNSSPAHGFSSRTANPPFLPCFP